MMLSHSQKGLRHCLKIALFVQLLMALGTTSLSAAWPAKLFAPYVDFTAWPPYDIVGAATNTGLRYATLAFIVADTSQNAATASPTNLPAWGGYTDYSAASGYRMSDITRFRSLGGDVVVSFGGASGTELAQYVTDTNRLLAAYQFVINTYSATRIDFDIEGAAVADQASIKRRSVAMARLQAAATAAGRALDISLTLPVLPTGLDGDGLQVLQSAVTNGVRLVTVNVMAMDYGDNAAPNPSGHMGDYACLAATNLFLQLKSVYQAANQTKTDAQLWQMVGVTPMLGVNDVTTEVFDQAAAAQLVSYANSRNLGELSFWSLNRDEVGGAGITQTTGQFTGIFLSYGGGGNATPIVSVQDAGVVLPTNGLASVRFPVTLSTAATGVVSVAYFTSDGTATAPADYVATNGILTFPPGSVSSNVVVSIAGSTNVAASKFFTLTLTNAVGASLFANQAIGTITNNNSSGQGGGGSGGSGVGSGECALTSQWLVTYNGASFRAVLTLANPNSTNLTLRTLAFTAPYTSVSWIASDAGLADWVIPTQAGSQFTIADGWNPAAVIPAGGSLALTFQAAPGTLATTAPTHLVVNGITVGDCGNQAFYFTSVLRQSNNLALTWHTYSGTTNLLQVSSDLIHWTNLTSPLAINGSGESLTNWTDIGALTNSAQRFYRIFISN